MQLFSLKPYDARETLENVSRTFAPFFSKTYFKQEKNKKKKNYEILDDK